MSENTATRNPLLSPTQLAQLNGQPGPRDSLLQLIQALTQEDEIVKAHPKHVDALGLMDRKMSKLVTLLDSAR